MCGNKISFMKIVNKANRLCPALDLCTQFVRIQMRARYKWLWTYSFWVCVCIFVAKEKDDRNEERRRIRACRPSKGHRHSLRRRRRRRKEEESEHKIKKHVLNRAHAVLLVLRHLKYFCFLSFAFGLVFVSVFVCEICLWICVPLKAINLRLNIRSTSSIFMV